MSPVYQLSPSSPQVILLAGASGLVGTALHLHLVVRGHEVRRLVRRPADQPGEFYWDPDQGRFDDHALSGVSTVINLAGANVAEGRWTEARRHLIMSSRVDSTRTLVEAMARVTPRPRRLINASAAGFYGDTVGHAVDESAARGHGFLADVCRAWEAEAGRAEQFGISTVQLRLGVVLSREGGALAKMLPLFRLGLGGRLGQGTQGMSWIALADLLRVFDFLIARESLVGAVNAVAPRPVSNAEFTQALARALGRPAVLPTPSWALRLVFGAMANETLLADSRVLPGRLQAEGFAYEHPDLAEGLAAALAETS